jgi:hypothetical protein
MPRGPRIRSWDAGWSVGLERWNVSHVALRETLETQREHEVGRPAG